MAQELTTVRSLNEPSTSGTEDVNFQVLSFNQPKRMPSINVLALTVVGLLVFVSQAGKYDNSGIVVSLVIGK